MRCLVISSLSRDLSKTQRIRLIKIPRQARDDARLYELARVLGRVDNQLEHVIRRIFAHCCVSVCTRCAASNEKRALN